MDWKQGRGEIFVQELEHPEYTTTARVHHEVSILSTHEENSAPHYQSIYGIIHCKTTVDGYYKVPLFQRGEKFPFQLLGSMAPDPLSYHTQAIWLTFSPQLLSNYSIEDQHAGLYSLAGAIKIATAIEELCDPSDIEALGRPLHPDTGLPTLMLYDTTPGGVGIAEAVFPHLKWVLLRAEQILTDCPYCSEHPESRGCPYCVTAQYGEETSINRHVAIELVRMLRTGDGSI